MKKPTLKKNMAPMQSPVRDEKALIFPISAIRLGKNVRDKLENIEELAASIKENGLLQPLVIAKVPGGFELVAGQRRLAAMKLLGEKSAPVRLSGADASQIGVLRLVENLQRDELSGWETCKAIHDLVPVFATQRKLAAAIGKTESYVSQCIAVAKLHAENKLQRVEVLQTLSLRELFGLLSKKDEPRQASGPVAGGRYVDGAIQIKQSGARFSLRLNFDPQRTPPATKTKIIDALRAIIQKLEAQEMPVGTPTSQ